jgi:formylglycine-generating enzyme required for sulfatase activity/serine/threonine protein kinase
MTSSMADNDESLGDQQTYEGGAQPVDSSDRSLGDRSTFGGGTDSSLSDIGGLTGDAELDMEIVDLSRYEVQQTLGKGGMGEVLLATDTRLNRKVAIKRMLGDATRSQTAVRRFLTEAQSIAAINHLNVVQIYDYGRAEDGPFLIMEYVDGGSLLDKCREGAIPLEEAVELTCQLCDGLGKAHEAGIIHRDIKPANVLLTNDGTPKLTDFGLARQDAADHGQTQTGSLLGTIDFMPPEQRRGATETDARSDLWSLAATLYQMVTGKSPKIIKFNNVPQALQDVLGKALEDEKDDRYQTAREFRDALRASQKLQAAPEPVAELGAGECPKCHTKNDVTRKFCRGCGESLRVSCLSCSGDIPVWENFCAECGGNQKELTSARDKRIQQRDEAYEEAASLLSQGDARGAYRLIGTVKTSDLRSSDEQLRSQLEKIVAAEDKLTALVKASKADGILDPDEVVAMWQATGSYLELNPRHEKIAGLQQQLEARIQKSPAEYAAFGELADFWLKQPLSSNSIGMQFKLLPGGTFTMGDGDDAHQVTLTKPFGLGVYEVTQEQYEKVMGTNPSKFKAPQNPVEQVSWTDAVEFCRKLSALPAEKKAGYVYRLPTEAEWECACRAGTTTTYSFGDSESELGDYAWYTKNSGRTTHPVGGKKPNGWGLYDMHGNVFEWCQDWYGSYPSGSVTDPTGAASGSLRVFRGGCWSSISVNCLSANRFGDSPDFRLHSLGFRVLRGSIK